MSGREARRQKKQPKQKRRDTDAPSRPMTDEDRLRGLERRVSESRKNANDLIPILEAFEDETSAHRLKLIALNCLRRVFQLAAKRGNLRAVRSSTEKNGGNDANVSKKESALRAYRLWMRSRFSQFVGNAVNVLSAPGDSVTSRKLRVASLRTLMLFVKISSNFLREDVASKCTYHFGNDIYAKILNRYVESSDVDDDVRCAIVEEYLAYHDVRLYTLRNLKRILERAARSDDDDGATLTTISTNAFDLMTEIRIPAGASKIDTFFVDASDEATSHEDEAASSAKKRKRRTEESAENETNGPRSGVRRVSSYRRAHEGCWLALLRCRGLSRAVFKRALLVLPKRVMPHMEHPVLLCDFLTDSYNAGGVVSLLALEGLFVLIQRHSLEYPQFYEKLYQLLTPSIFVVTYRERLLRLLHQCLLSTHLPSYLVAAFLKRLGRLCLVAPPSGSLFVVPLLYNMLKRHPQCEALVQRGRAGYASDAKEKEDPSALRDPFVSSASAPRDSQATESSLWELRALQNHYCPAVSSMAAVFDEQEREMFQISDFTSTSYAALFEQSVRRGKRRKRAPAKTFRFEDPLMEAL